MTEGFLLRNAFNIQIVTKVVKRIKANYPNFNDKEFLEKISKEIETLNFGDRSKLIKSSLTKYLPDNFFEASTIILKSLGPEAEIDPKETNWDSLIYWPIADYIADKGVTEEEYFDQSMKLLYEITKRATSEFAIRKFIIKYPQKTLEKIYAWVNDDNAHIRRLTSEGIRPRLPLSSPLKIFKENPKPVIELLEKLKDDPELYVRRSVANNLNDISKDNPEIVIETLHKWNKDANKERKWLIKHALRTLLKQGNKDALALIGFTNASIEDCKISLEKPKINIGNKTIVKAQFKSLNKQKLMIDYVIHYMKSNGKKSEKVFKLDVKDAIEGEEVSLQKKHSFKQMTTRKHYPGEHKIELIVNGERFSEFNFELNKGEEN